MANATSRLQIQIDAKNNASGAIKGVSNDLAGLDKGAALASKGIAGLAIAGGVAGIAAMGAAAVGAAMDLGRLGAQSMDVAKSFDTMAASAGESSAAMLAGLQEASRGAISEYDLMLTANRSMLLGVADSTEEMAALMDVARARSQAMGITTAQAFGDIITGIGRMSPLILDNLGIVVDQAAANEEYAKSIGTTVSKLTEQEKKQALVNAVLKDSADLVAANEAAGDDMASKFERMDAALANAKGALGELFSPAIAAIAQNLADAVTEVTDAMMTSKVEGAQSTLATLGAEIGKLAEQYENARLATSVALLHPENMAAAEQQMANVTGQLAAFGAQYNKAAAIAGAPLLDLAALQEGIIAFDEATLGLNNLAGATPGAAAGLGQVGLSADALSARLADLKAQSDATRNALAGITNAAVGALHSAASAAVGIMPSSEIAKIYTENEKRINAQAAAMHAVGMETADIDFRMQELAKKAAAPFDIAVEAAREAEKANKATGSSVEKLSEEYSDLQSKVSSALSGALDVGVGVDPDDVLAALGFPREDEINENARRLADIAKNGLKNQEWLDEFKNEVPDIWQMIRTAQNPQEEAARLLADFQDGLLTSPIDKSKVKEIVRRQIMGDENMAALANEIAGELAAEMGIPLQQALAATNGAMGTGAGAGGQAATTFSDAASDGLDDSDGGGAFVDKFTEQMRARYSLLETAGRDAGKTWGESFLAIVGENVPPGLISLLTELVTPGVMAKFAQQGTLQGTAP